MDEKKSKVHEIALMLKELHLAANMEEALKRAEEMLKGGEGDTLKNLVAEAKGELKEDIISSKSRPSAPKEEVQKLKQASDDDKTLVKLAEKVKKKK